LAALAAAQAAQAQADDAAGAAPSGAQAPVAGLQDIVVTARRSAETLQSVPVAVTALTGQFLDRQNMVDASTIPQFAPNITIAQQPSSLSAATVFIRGIGNNEPSSLSEQGVGLYLDGIYMARAAGALFDLVDLERVEVLRGPQGTLFGRNTIGGAVQLVSKKPTNDFHVEAKAGYGKYNEWYTRARVDTGYIGGSPIKMSISGQHRQADGYVNNTLAKSSDDPGSLNANSLLAAVQGDFGKLTVNYNFDYDDRRGAPAYFQILAATPDVQKYYSQSPNFGGPPFLIGTDRMQNVEQAGFVDRSGHYRFRSHSRIQGHSLTLTYAVLPELTLKSITGYRRFFQDTILGLSGNGDLQGVVLDPITFAPSVGSVTPYNGNNAPQREHQFSQEFQALGKAGDFSYLAGVYYFKEKASENNRQALTFVLPGGDAGLNLTPVQAFGGTAESAAVFGQVSWKPSALDEKLEITGGARYTQDKKTAYLAGDVQPVERGRTNFDNVSWLASASYHVTKDIMAYARASTGYRSGGINPRASFINTFSPETAHAYEIGLKSEFWQHKLRVNLAGYLTDYNNLQVNQFAAGTGGSTSLIVNAGKVQLKGFEAEVTAAPVRGLEFDGSVGYVDTKYKEFLFRDPVTNIISDVHSIAKPVYSPKWTIHVGGEYSMPVSIGTARVRVDYSYRSTMYFNALDATAPFNEDIRSRPDKNLKARLSLEDVDIGGAKMEFGVWGDNLTNQKNIAYGIDFGSLGFAGGTFKKPISFGGDAKIKF
jgi:iron complex outermembrane receptor protein